jgi:hypothetical protein
VDTDLDHDDGRTWPVLGGGDAPFGTWALRAMLGSNPPGSDWQALYVRIAFRDLNGQSIGGSGFGGVGLADEDRPLVISSTSRRSDPSVCWIGQVVADADRVEARFDDGARADATLLVGELPVKLWVVFVRPDNRLVALRALQGDRELAAIPWISDHTPNPRSGSVWGPLPPDEAA